jgi:hypothetical protein
VRSPSRRSRQRRGGRTLRRSTTVTRRAAVRRSSRSTRLSRPLIYEAVSPARFGRLAASPNRSDPLAVKRRNVDRCRRPMKSRSDPPPKEASKRRPRHGPRSSSCSCPLSCFGGKATVVLASLLRFNVSWVRVPEPDSVSCRRRTTFRRFG